LCFLYVILPFKDSDYHFGIFKFLSSMFEIYNSLTVKFIKT